jgi:hypothetical protein
VHLRGAWKLAIPVAVGVLTGCSHSAAVPSSGLPPHDNRCSVTTNYSGFPGIPPGHHSYSSPKAAMAAGITFGRPGRVPPPVGPYQQQASNLPNVDYFVHYSGQQPDYQLEVAKTSDGGWFLSEEGLC